MATVLPDNPAAQLTFFTVHAPIWVEHADAVGLTPERAAAVAEATAAAAEAYRAAQEARQTALAATQAWRNASEQLRRLGGGAIATIKGFAETSGNPGPVLVAAGLPEPGRPGPKRRNQAEINAAVPRIRNCTARPDAFGNVEVEWTCGQGAAMGAGAGMMYRVERSIEGERGGAFVFLNVVGSPGAGRRSVRFVDDAVPAGAREIRYMVTPLRGSGVGAPGPVAIVRFGSAGSVTLRAAA